MPISENINNSYIILTGASRGIGKAIAIFFAKKGEKLILISRNQCTLNETADEIRSYSDCITFAADVSDYKKLEDISQKLQSDNIKIKGIINNAGISFFGLFQDFSPKEWNEIVSVNLSSVFYMCKYFSSNMINNKSGFILNISSVWGNVGAACEVAYSATKGGINAFTKALAKELAPSNINVNAIACGAIDTEMNNRLSQEEKDDLNNEIPFGRMGTPYEVATLAYNIYSSPAYLTGQIITLDGGWI